MEGTGDPISLMAGATTIPNPLQTGSPPEPTHAAESDAVIEVPAAVVPIDYPAFANSKNSVFDLGKNSRDSAPRDSASSSGSTAPILPAARNETSCPRMCNWGLGGDVYEEEPAHAADPNEDSPEAIAARTDFGDLEAQDGPYTIEDTAERSITLTQLIKVCQHIERRLSQSSSCFGLTIPGERWVVSRKEGSGFRNDHVIKSPGEVNLYDADKYLIRPATWRSKLALVEASSWTGFFSVLRERVGVQIMAGEQQPPDLFVSHVRGQQPLVRMTGLGGQFWGESIMHFTACLLQHSLDRGLEHAGDIPRGACCRVASCFAMPNPSYLEGRSPRYWVCAYALRQHDLETELGGKPLHEMPFARAIKLARGTVSVVDSKAECFSRVWCVYELYSSLLEADTKYTYDIVTAQPHCWKDWDASHGYSGCCLVLMCCVCRFEQRSAVTLVTGGLAAVDLGAKQKEARERHFPVELLHKGVQFESQEGQASMAADKAMILAAIGDKHQLLDQTVHGVVAAAGLRAAFEAGGTMRDDFLAAICVGRLRKLSLGLTGSDADSEDNLKKLVAALDPATLEVLDITSRASGSWLDGLAGQKWSKLKKLVLSYCNSLQSLPDGIWSGMGKLKTLDLCGCSKLRSLSTGMEQLASLRYLDVRYGTPKPTQSVVDSLEAQGCKVDLVVSGLRIDRVDCTTRRQSKGNEMEICNKVKLK